MINGKKILAIIPARGGSKRLPRKNILPLAGKPLIAWTIEAAIESAYIDKVIVSTDDTEIGAVAESYGVDMPFYRPAYLSSDTATSIDVVLHAIDKLSETNEYYDLIVLLQPTSPLRGSEHINQAFIEYVEKKAVSIVSVCKTEHSPIWCNTLPLNNSMTGFLPSEFKNMRSQDLPTYYRLNGAIYISSVDNLKKTKSFIEGEKAFASIMATEKSIDIDELIDFQIAEMLIDT